MLSPLSQSSLEHTISSSLILPFRTHVHSSSAFSVKSHLCALESSWGQRAEKEVLSDTRYFNLRLKGGLLRYSLGNLEHNSLPKFSLVFHTRISVIYIFFLFNISINKVNVQKTRLTIQNTGLSATRVGSDSNSSWLGLLIWFVHMITIKQETDILLSSK